VPRKGGTPKNLIPNPERSPEKLKEMGASGGKKSGEVRREKAKVSSIMANLLMQEHDIEIDGVSMGKMSGEKLLGEVAVRIIAKGDNTSVAMMRLILDATEGSKSQLTGDGGAPLKMTVEIVDPKK
jgi:hypothetical protein